jgi:hypothetical protein
VVIEMEDGGRIDMGLADAALIWPDHDAWTVGNEPWVFLEFPTPTVWWRAKHMMPAPACRRCFR